MMKLQFVIISLCLAAALSEDYYCSKHKGATYQQGAYHDIRVFIDSTEPEDFSIIQNIQDLFSNASDALYTALNSKGYFGSVRIIIPSTWNPPSGKSYPDATVDDVTESVAEFRVAPKNPDKGMAPYCQKRAAECGKEGDYVHLTSDFMKMNAKLGNIKEASKKVVQTFAEQRYGVFPEHYDPTQTPDRTRNYPFDSSVCLSYYDPLPTSCPKFESGKSGKYVDDSQKTCKPCATTSYKNVTNQHVKPPACHKFSPDFSGDQDYSLMYTTSVDTVVHFCNSSNHNSDAPSLHNAHCQRQSVWTIINKNVDFNPACGQHNSEPRIRATGTKPTFSVVRNNDPRSVAFVLDVSGSMASNNPTRIKVLNLAATSAIECIPEGEKIAVTKFSSSATTLHNLAAIVDDASRVSLENSIPSTAGGGTALGQGIEKGIEVLIQGLGSGKTQNARLIIISDGAENIPPDAESAQVQLMIRDSGVSIDTIGISSQAALVLIELANEYGGSFFFLDTGSNAWRQSLQTAISTLCKITRPADQRNNVAQLFSATTSDPAGTFFVDKFSSGSSTMLFLNPTGHISVQLTQPDGSIVNSSSPSYHVRSGGNTVSIRLNTTQQGEWKYAFSTTYEAEIPQENVEEDVGTGNQLDQKPADDNRTPKSSAKLPESSAAAGQEVTILVSAEALSSDLTLAIAASYNRQNVTDLATEPLIVYTTVRAGPGAVTAATVNVTISPPSSCGVANPADVYLELKDDGMGADSVADDGIYSAYFMDFSSIKVANTDCRFAGSVTTEGDEHTMFNNAGVPEKTGRFTRYATISYFTVHVAEVPKGDVTPPGQINDFAMIGTNIAKDTVSFQWTAPGSDYYEGTAAEYQIWYAPQLASLVALNFTEIRLVNGSQVVSGSVNSSFVPHVAGTTETITLTNFPNNTVLFFGIRTLDEAGNVATLSNILQVDILALPSSAPLVNKTSFLLMLIGCLIPKLILQ